MSTNILKIDFRLEIPTFYEISHSDRVCKQIAMSTTNTNQGNV